MVLSVFLNLDWRLYLDSEFKVYGIEYSVYATGKGGVKLVRGLDRTEMFLAETEFLVRYVELKRTCGVGNIRLFESPVIKQKYEIGTI
jgi:hypothetical protein